MQCGSAKQKSNVSKCTTTKNRPLKGFYGNCMSNVKNFSLLEVNFN